MVTGNAWSGAVSGPGSPARKAERLDTEKGGDEVK